MAENFISKKITFLLDHINQAVNIALNNRPVDLKLRFFFRENKYLGSKDRYIISEVIYFILRSHSFLAKHSSNIEETAFYICYNESSEFREKLSKLIKGFDPDVHLNVNKDIYSTYQNAEPEIFYPKQFLEIFNDVNPSLLKALNTEATTDIRIISNEEDIQSELEENNISFRKNILPHCLKISSRIPMNNINSYRKGYFELQDEGSQIISLSLPLSNAKTILDACAGGGGKSIHIAELTNDKKRIVSTDIKHSRLNELKRRVEKLELNSIEIEDFEEVKKNSDMFDLVLIDAPCSGSGTMRRSPELRYDLSINKVREFAEIQLGLLNDFSKKVKAGGHLAYVTCSVFDAENEDIIEKFLSGNSDFELDLPDISNVISAKETNIIDNKYLKLNPQTHQTDGFFMALLKKIK